LWLWHGPSGALRGSPNPGTTKTARAAYQHFLIKKNQDGFPIKNVGNDDPENIFGERFLSANMCSHGTWHVQNFFSLSRFALSDAC
jgi:hypothetical protein